MAKLPPLAPFPPTTLRLQIAPQEWLQCIEAWITSAEAYLKVPDTVFNDIASHSDSYVTSFVTSYVQRNSESRNQSELETPGSLVLRKRVYLLCYRLLLSPRPNDSILHWIFLSDFARLFSQISNIRHLLTSVWEKHSSEIESSLRTIKNSIIRSADNHISEPWIAEIQRLVDFIKLCPAGGTFFATGSDFIDSFADVYPKTSRDTQDSITAFTYLILLSLVQLRKPNYSVLSDHLFSLKANAKELHQKSQPSLLSAIVSNTDFINTLQAMSESDSETPGTVPPRDLSVGLLEFRTPRARSRKNRKGKERVNGGANEALEAVHLHRMSLITQIQDLFQDLGSGFIAKLLDEYNEDVEVVTAHLLDNALPPHLANVDRSEQLEHYEPSSISATSHIDHVPSTPPAYPRHPDESDGDELDALTVDASKLHIGKANADLTADQMLSRGASNHKAAILAALAKFDSDDDEYNDTYDETDVGGTVDNTVDAVDRPAKADEAEVALFRTWKSEKAAFGRDYGTRRSVTRAKLKQETGWTDEAIEGWAIMLEREPNRVRALEKRFADTWKGEQRSIERTAWRAGGKDDESSGAEASGTARGGHTGHARGGRGGPRGGRGAYFNTAGSPDDRGTQKAMQRKETRGGGGHNRREGRAKKMARGMS
jgi:activating signal cointegrator complex subunit 2